MLTECFNLRNRILSSGLRSQTGKTQCFLTMWFVQGVSGPSTQGPSLQAPHVFVCCIDGSEDRTETPQLLESGDQRKRTVYQCRVLQITLVGICAGCRERKVKDSVKECDGWACVPQWEGHHKGPLSVTCELGTPWPTRLCSVCPPFLVGGDTWLV